MGGFTNENGKRDFAGCGYSCPPAIGQSTNDLPRVQPSSEKENGPLFERIVFDGWDCVVLLALLVFGGAVL